RLVMTGKKNLPLKPVSELFLNFLGKTQLGARPRWKRLTEGVEAGWRVRNVRLQQAFELDQRVFVEHRVVQHCGVDSGFAAAVAYGIPRKPWIVFAPAETLLLSGRDDFAVANQRRGGIVIVSGDAENVGTHRPWVPGGNCVP